VGGCGPEAGQAIDTNDRVRQFDRWTKALKSRLEDVRDPIRERPRRHRQQRPLTGSRSKNKHQEEPEQEDSHRPPLVALAEKSEDRVETFGPAVDPPKNCVID